MDPLGFGIGVAFGALLFLSGLADPDKIIGTLRLKDFHAMRVIAGFVLFGLLGVTVLDLFGIANFSIKPAAVLSVAVGGALLGAGFGLTGFCPGTGVAAAATGRIDALWAMLGMLGGALAFIFVHPYLAVPLDAVVNWGKVTFPGITELPRSLLTAPIVLVGAYVLWRTRPRAPSRA